MPDSLGKSRGSMESLSTFYGSSGEIETSSQEAAQMLLEEEQRKQKREMVMMLRRRIFVMPLEGERGRITEFGSEVVRHRLQLLTEVADWFQKRRANPEILNKLIQQSCDHTESLYKIDGFIEAFSHKCTFLSKTTRRMVELGLKLLKRRFTRAIESRVRKVKPTESPVDEEVKVEEVSVLQEDINVWKKSVSTMEKIMSKCIRVPCLPKAQLEQVLESGGQLIAELANLYDTQIGSLKKIQDTEDHFCSKYGEYSKKLESTNSQILKDEQELKEQQDSLDSVQAKLTQSQTARQKVRQRVLKMERLASITSSHSPMSEEEVATLEADSEKYKEMLNILCAETSRLKSLIDAFEAMASRGHTTMMSGPGVAMERLIPGVATEKTALGVARKKMAQGVEAETAAAGPANIGSPTTLTRTGAAVSTATTTTTATRFAKTSMSSATEAAMSQPSEFPPVSTTDHREHPHGFPALEPEDHILYDEEVPFFKESISLRNISGKPKPPGSKPPGSKPPGSRPPGSKPSGSEPSGSMPPGSEPLGFQSADSKPPDTTLQTRKQAMFRLSHRLSTAEENPRFLIGSGSTLTAPAAAASTKPKMPTGRIQLKSQKPFTKGQLVDDVTSKKVQSTPGQPSEPPEKKKEIAGKKPVSTKSIKDKIIKTEKQFRSSLTSIESSYQLGNQPAVSDHKIGQYGTTGVNKDPTPKAADKKQKTKNPSAASHQDAQTLGKKKEKEEGGGNVQAQPVAKRNVPIYYSLFKPKKTQDPLMQMLKGSKIGSPNRVQTDPSTSKKQDQSQNASPRQNQPGTDPDGLGSSSPESSGIQQNEPDLFEPPCSQPAQLEGEKQTAALKSEDARDDSGPMSISSKLADSSEFPTFRQIIQEENAYGFISSSHSPEGPKVACGKKNGHEVVWLHRGADSSIRRFMYLRNATATELASHRLSGHAEAIRSLVTCDMTEKQDVVDVADVIQKELEPTLLDFEYVVSNAIRELRKEYSYSEPTEKERPLSLKKKGPDVLPSGLEEWSMCSEKMKTKEQEYCKTLEDFGSLWSLYNRVRTELHCKEPQSIPSITVDTIEEYAESEEKEEEEEDIPPTVFTAMPQAKSYNQKPAETGRGQLPKDWKQNLDFAKAAFKEGAIPHNDYMEQVTICLKMAALLQLKIDTLGNSKTELRFKQVLATRIEAILDQVDENRSKLEALQKAGVLEYSAKLAGLDRMEQALRIEHEQTVISVAMAEAHENVRAILKRQMCCQMETIEETSEPSVSSSSSSELESPEEEEEEPTETTEREGEETEDIRKDTESAEDVAERDIVSVRVIKKEVSDVETEDQSKKLEKSEPVSPPEISDETVIRVASSDRMTPAMSTSSSSSQIIDWSEPSAHISSQTPQKLSTSVPTQDSVDELVPTSDDETQAGQKPDGSQHVHVVQPQFHEGIALILPHLSEEMAKAPASIDQRKPSHPKRIAKYASEVMVKVAVPESATLIPKSRDREILPLPILFGTSSSEMLFDVPLSKSSTTSFGIDSLVTSCPSVSKMKLCMETKHLKTQPEKRERQYQQQLKQGPGSLPPILLSSLPPSQRKRMPSSPPVERITDQSRPSRLPSLDNQPETPALSFVKVMAPGKRVPLPKLTPSPLTIAQPRSSKPTSQTAQTVRPSVAVKSTHRSISLPDLSGGYAETLGQYDTVRSSSCVALTRTCLDFHREKIILKGIQARQPSLFPTGWKDFAQRLGQPTSRQQMEKMLRHQAAVRDMSKKLTVMDNMIQRPITPTSMAVENVREWVYQNTAYPPAKTCKIPSKENQARQRKRQNRFVQHMFKQQCRVLSPVSEEHFTTADQVRLDNAEQDSKDTRDKQGRGWPTGVQGRRPSIPALLESRLHCMDIDQTHRKAARILNLVRDQRLEPMGTDSTCQHIWNKFDSVPCRLR